VNWVEHAIVLAVAAGVTLLTTPVARLVGARWGIVARAGGRHVHTGTVPRIGGAGMFAGLIAAVAVRWIGERQWDWQQILTASDGAALAVLGGIGLVFAIGLLDDIVDLPPGRKMLGQILAAGLTVAGGVRIEFVGDPFSGGIIMLGVLAIPITLIWLVSFANIVNLIDGLDGLAAGVTAIAAVSLFVLALESNQPLAAFLAVAIVGMCIGFLRYNFHPASVFMGDSGALLLGFSLGCISLTGVMKSTAAIALVVPILIVGVPVFDTLSAIIRRKRHGRPIQRADKGHIHHRLLARGFSQRQTVLIIYVWSAALAVGGYAMRWVPTLYKSLTFLVLAVLSGLMASWLGLFQAAHHDDQDS